MRHVGLLALSCMLLLSIPTTAAEPDPKLLIKQVVTAVGGEDKLLKLFRTRETVNVSSDPEKKVPARVSVYEPPKYWWTGKPWYFSEIVELERLKELPEGLKRR